MPFPLDSKPLPTPWERIPGGIDNRIPGSVKPVQPGNRVTVVPNESLVLDFRVQVAEALRSGLTLGKISTLIGNAKYAVSLSGEPEKLAVELRQVWKTMEFLAPFRTHDATDAEIRDALARFEPTVTQAVQQRRKALGVRS